MLDRMSMPLARGRVVWSQLGGGGSTAALLRRVLLWTKVAAGVWWLPGLLGLALGRAAVFGTLAPFGTALSIALAAQGRPRRALACAIGAAVGAWTSPAVRATAGAAGAWVGAMGGAAGEGPTGPVHGWLPLLGLVIALAAARRGRRSPWLAALAAALAVAVIRVALAGAGPGGLLTAGLTGAAELAAALAFLPAAGLAGIRPASLTHGQVVSVLALTSFTVLGIQGLEWQGIAVAPLFSRLLVLLVAFVGGAGFGAAAGTGLGVISFLAAAPSAVPTRVPWEAAVLAPAGFLAGLGALAGKPGAIAGLLVAHVLLTPLAGSGAEIGHALLLCLLAAAGIAVVPTSSLRSLAARLPGTPERERLHRQRLRQANARAQDQLHRVAAVFQELSQTFAQQGAGETEEAAFDRFATRVWESVCRECSHQRVCWERHPYQTYRDLMATVANAGPDGSLRSHDLAEGLRQRCIKPPQLLRAVSGVLESMRVESYWRTRLQESQELVPRQLAGIAGIIAGVAEQMERSGAPVDAADGEAAWAPRFDVDVSVAQAAHGESAVSGDCFRRVELGPDRVAFILSDGMGTGPRAAAESHAAVAMLQRFLEAGFDLEFAVHTINSVLLLRSPDETYATLDACVVDLTDGTVQMLKVGAAPTFVRRRDEVEVVRAANVPVGILSRVETRIVTCRLDAGDMVVMVTDGVLEACRAKGDREEALRRILGRLGTNDAHDAVDALFGRLRQRTGPAFPDDVTLVAFQLTERGRRGDRRFGRRGNGRSHSPANGRPERANMPDEPDTREAHRSAAWAVQRLRSQPDAVEQGEDLPPGHGPASRLAPRQRELSHSG
ncbi:MAG TPA: SpoIIE family protein phosphatase [Limnochordales bacterium]